MTDAVMDRGALKAVCIAVLDRVAMEHPAGHQGKLAARYLLRASLSEPIALMFEKAVTVPANLWVAESYSQGLLTMEIPFRHYPAAGLYHRVDQGRTNYGRHAALKSMRDMAHADLVRFTIDRPTQLEAVLARLFAL